LLKWGAFPPGKYELHYKVFSADFPVLEFEIALDLTGEMETTTAGIVG